MKTKTEILAEFREKLQHGDFMFPDGDHFVPNKEALNLFLSTSLEEYGEQCEEKGRNDAVDYIEKETDTVCAGKVINIANILDSARQLNK